MTMVAPSDVQALIAAVETARTNVLNTARSLTEQQASFRPAEGTWTVTENLEHLFLAELSGVTKIWSALEQYQRGVRWTDALPNRGVSIEEVVARTWRLREVAPPIATPHVGGPAQAWRAAVQSSREVLQELGQLLEGLPLEDIVFPHFLSGSLDVRQRLEFLRFHLDRHHDQIRRVISAPGVPAA